MMIESEIKGTLSSESLRKVALVLIISSISLASFLIIESVSTLSSTFGQIESLQANSSRSNQLTMDDYDILGNPFYSENTKSTNIKVSSIDPIPTVEVTYTGTVLLVEHQLKP